MERPSPGLRGEGRVRERAASLGIAVTPLTRMVTQFLVNGDSYF